MPDPGEVSLRDGWKGEQRQRSEGPEVTVNRAGNEEREIVTRVVVEQRFDLPAYDATDTGGLANGRRVVDDELHSPL